MPLQTMSGWGRLLDIGDIDLATQLHQVNPQAAQAMAEEINSPEQLRAADLVEVDIQGCADLYKSVGYDGPTSTIATGVFCTIVSSSSSRCTSAVRCSRSTSPSAL